MSLAQEFMDPEEDAEFEVWLVSVLAMKAVPRWWSRLCTVAGWLLHALETSRVVEQQKPWKTLVPKGGLRMEVSKEFRLNNATERIAYLEVLAGLAWLANEIRDGEGEYIVADSWELWAWLWKGVRRKEHVKDRNDSEWASELLWSNRRETNEGHAEWPETAAIQSNVRRVYKRPEKYILCISVVVSPVDKRVVGCHASSSFILFCAFSVLLSCWHESVEE
jgi:hypothetical protein